MHRAIETVFAGYKFRSRLEARWAVFLDDLGLKWTYEPEGFELPSGRYLPDFFVSIDESCPQARKWPGAGYWVEVKPIVPTPEESQRMRELVHATQHQGYIVSGLPCENVPKAFSTRAAPPEAEGALAQMLRNVDHIMDDPFEMTFHAAFIFLGKPLAAGIAREDVERAAVAARSARFEFRDALRRGR